MAPAASPSLSLLAEEISSLQRKASLLKDPAVADYFASVGQTLQLALLDLYGLDAGFPAEPEWPSREG